ncbi:hypothetical protein QCA50_000342 [Cerrena zonata]|uniref:WIBG Mago-binding domain-containing protein n=1 Tax=Cerrena zonata TaxID=2478898 RepID=A0AAW0GQD7_9APHY
MSKPDLFPKTSTAGITVDPKTLERVIPESRRPDGTVRKQIKIRPGFTPQEDVSRFRGKRQAQADANTLPKGHILGWTPPPATTAASDAAKSKSAKKNEKRKEKRKEKAAADVAAKIKDNWDDDEEEEVTPKSDGASNVTAKNSKQNEGDALADKLGKLEVR